MFQLLLQISQSISCWLFTFDCLIDCFFSCCHLLAMIPLSWNCFVWNMLQGCHGARLGSFGSEHGMTNWRVERFEDVDMGSEPAEWESIVPAYPSPCKCYSWRACHTTFVHHFLHQCLLHPWILLNVLQVMCCGIKLAPQEKFLDHDLPTKF